MPFAFTTTEFELARSRGPLFAERLCIAYSAKEALFKALGAPYDFTECEVPAVDIASSSRDQGNRLQLGEGLRDAFGVSDAVLFAQRHPSSEEIIATVIAYREDDH